jgi:hypothetical protein
MRPLGLTLGFAYVVATVGAAYVTVFFATFPFENQSSEDRAALAWLIPVGAGLALLAIATLIALAVRRRGWALVTFALGAGLAAFLLAWAVRVSDHSDGKLVAWALAIELTGLGAVSLGRGRRAES